MTIHNTKGDALELEKTKIYYPISSIEAVNTGESLLIKKLSILMLTN